MTINSAGVISYYTSGGVYTSAEGTKNSYNNVYNTAVVNNRSRYYYNADIESYTANSTDAGYKLLYWSLNRYAASNIKRCFTNPFSTNVLTGAFDLKNISYYPIDISSDVTIGDASFIFYNSEIEESEMGSDTKRSTRETVTSGNNNYGKSQHYMMHMGLFRNVSATVTTTGNITLYGSVGVNSVYSGALINGILTGSLNTANAKNIFLGDANYSIPLEISDTSRYLLINMIGDKAVMNLNGLWINNVYDTSSNTTYASSLIGDVQGTGISLTFNNIKIDARNKENVPITSSRYGTSKSIFSNATLLNKYDVDSTSVAVYNFSQKEDWGSSTNTSMTNRSNGYGKVTYGRELTDSVEYKDEENRYYENGENGNYISPVKYHGAYSSDTAPLGTKYDFSSDYLPYVRYFTSDTTKISNPPAAMYSLREIKVNVVPSDLKEGCGTYDHPYSITSPKQLTAVSIMLDYNNSAETALIPSIMLPETNSGTHWCCTGSTGSGAQEKNTESCLLFTYDTNAEKYKHEFTHMETDSETGEETTVVDRTVYWEIKDVRKYLASAYYQIGSNITLTTTFTGLGAYDSEYAFKGVVVGLNNNITVTNNTTTPFIKVSNGSVVKDLKIVVNSSNIYGAKDGGNGTIFNYKNNELFYGGVIGKIMGGDNIIDNVSMTYSNNGYIKTQNKYLMCVGGYVGVIVNGGLVFRNMNASKFISKDAFKVNKDGASTAANWVLDEDNTTAHGHLFVNPYIGRVINGYAINETTSYSGDTDAYTLDNGTKNYQIADVITDVSEDSSVTDKPHKLYYDTKVNTDDRVNISDGQALFMLSLITQSGAGTATTADGDYAYAIGYDGTTHYGHVPGVDTSAYNVATHLADYDEVGSIKYSQKTTGDYSDAAKDKYEDSKAVPYIIYHYTKADTSGNYPARKMTGATDFMKLSTAGGTYNLPESFRGIGSICDGKSSVQNGTSKADKVNEYQMHIYGFEGNGATINEQIIFNTYVNTNDNYANKVYENSNINLGFGLFNILVQKAKDADGTAYNLDEGYYIGNFNLTGKVVVKEYNTSGVEQTGGFDTTNGNKSPHRNRYSVGGLAGGTLVTQFTRSNASAITNSSIETYVNVYDLDLVSLTITGTSWCGGYIGRNNITEYDSNYGSGKMNLFFNGCDATKVIITGSQGCSGGILGGSMSGFPSLYINTAKPKSGDTHSTGTDGYFSSTMKLSIINNGDCSQCGIGAVAGTIRNGYEVTLWVNNLTVEGYGANNGFSNESTSVKTTWTQGVGGLFGFVRKADSVVITNCEVKNIDISGPMSGGLFGNIDYYDTAQDFGVSPKIKIFNTKIYSGNNNNNISAIIGAGGVSGQFVTSKSYTDSVVGYNGDTFIYDIDGCEVYGYTISQTGTDDKECGAGGFIGYANNAQRTIVNSRVHDCTIKVDGSNGKHGMGGLVGDTSKGIWGYNIASYNNTFGYNGTGTSAKCGGFIGNTNKKELKIVGFTRKNNTMTDGTVITLDWDINSIPSSGSYVIDADYMNISTGTNHGTAMAVGFDNGTPVGEGAAKNYFPYVTVSPKVTVGEDNFLTGDGVSIVDVEKTVEVEGGEDETVTVSVPVAKLITDENTGTAADNRIAYKTVSNDDIKIVKNLISYGEDTSADHDIKLTTYFTEMGQPEGYDGDDFPIIAINGGAANYNSEINAYIRTLTNTTDSYTAGVDGKYSIALYPCQCKDGVYRKVDGTPGFQLNSQNYVMVDSAADSVAGNNQITMIDISFLDPTDKNKVAYHLYVPILTKKMLKFDFSSSALQGTEYEPSDYVDKFPSEWNKTSKLAAGFDSWQTIYAQFDYSKSEMDTFLATGKGLNWNTSKTLYFNYNGNKSLANSTQFVLLDNNNNVDKEYYITKADISTETNSAGNKFDVIKFGDFTTERNGAAIIDPADKFKPQTLNEIAGRKLRYAEDPNGAYVKCGESEATVYVYTDHTNAASTDKKFFKAWESGTAQRYTITVNDTISETYYLSMYSFDKDNVDTDNSTTHDAYGLTVASPLTFTSDVITCQRSQAKNTEMFLGNFLSQTLSIANVNDNVKISSENHTLKATLSSTVAFTGRNANYFHKNLAGEKLYQGFFLYLNRYNEKGEITSDCTIKGQPNYSYTRSINGESYGSAQSGGLDENAPYLYVLPVEIVVPAYAEGTSWSSSQSATVNIDFGTNEVKLNKEFPTRNKATNDYKGIEINSTVKLDFLRDRVIYSNNKKDPLPEDKPTERYYIDRTTSNGILTLTAFDQAENDEYDIYGEQSHNKSALGINGNYIGTGSKYSTMGDFEHIEVGMDYDVSALPAEIFDGKHTLNFKIVLEQKVDDQNETTGYKYIPVNIEDFTDDEEHLIKGYLSEFAFYGKSAETPLSLDADETTSYLSYTYSMPMKIDKSEWTLKYTETETQKHITGNIEFNAKTNGELEAIDGYLYTNYRLKVTASISGTSYTSTDWIVYTNAKMNAQYVKAS